MECIFGSFLDIETSIAVKDFFNSFGCSNYNYEKPINILFDFRYYFLLNNTLFYLENSSIIFLIGSNLRLESPLLNLLYAKISYIMVQKFIVWVWP